MEVASPQGWNKNRSLVLDFYNQRRKQALHAEPNAGHFALANLEKHFDVTVVTQNVDNLHEKAGSSNVMHLHGQLFQSRSTVDPSLVYEMDDWQLNEGDTCEKGSQLRPNIVWFGEMVPMMEKAIIEAQKADLFMVVGTSLLVYPAAGLVNYTSPGVPIFVIDPNKPELSIEGVTYYAEPASTGTPKCASYLIEKET